MPSGVYKIADHVFEIRTLYPYTQELCEEYLSGEKPEIILETTEEDIAFEREKSAREDIKEGRPVQHWEEDYLESLSVYRKMAAALLEKDILLFHGSVIAVDGKAYLFTAKSGTGKSTHTRLWREKFGQRAVMINDDKPLLKVTDEGVTVFGTPWDGKHSLSTNTSAPLKAICILNRGEENQIERTDAGNAYPMLLQQCNRPEDAALMVRTLELLDKLAANVALFRLKCNMEPQAAEISYAGMQEENE